MAEQKLDLLKLTAGFVTQTAKVVRSNILQAAFRASGLHHAPDDLRTESNFPNPLSLIDWAKYLAHGDAGGGHPFSHPRFDPDWHWNCPYMAALPDHIGDHPMLFSLLEAFQGQLGYLCPSQTASQQNSNHSLVTFAAQAGLIKHGGETLTLFRSQPVADPHTMLFHSLNPPDSSRQIGT
jgi:hypothetical protein